MAKEMLLIFALLSGLNINSQQRPQPLTSDDSGIRREYYQPGDTTKFNIQPVRIVDLFLFGAGVACPGQCFIPKSFVVMFFSREVGSFKSGALQFIADGKQYKFESAPTNPMFQGKRVSFIHLSIPLNRFQEIFRSEQIEARIDGIEFTFPTATLQGLRAMAGSQEIR